MLIKFKMYIIIGIMIFFSAWLGALISETKTIFSSLVWPIIFFGDFLAEQEGSEDFYKILYGGISSFIYGAILLFIPLIMAKETPNSETSLLGEVILYTEEISAAMETIEKQDANESEIEDAIDHLMTSITSEVVNIFRGKVNHRKIRYGFLVSDPNSGEIMKVKLAHHFPVTVKDMKVVEWVCANHTENPYLEGTVRQCDSSNDMEVIGLIRNPGNFRFGLVIFLPDKKLINKKTKADFKAAAVAVQHIAYMDKLYHLMVKFNKDRLTGGGS